FTFMQLKVIPLDLLPLTKLYVAGYNEKMSSSFPLEPFHGPMVLYFVNLRNWALSFEFSSYYLTEVLSHFIPHGLMTPYFPLSSTFRQKDVFVYPFTSCGWLF